MSVQLSAPDLKRLQKILEVGHRLEKIWQSPNANDATQLDRVSAEQESSLSALKTLIAKLEIDAESADLKRLAFHARNLTQAMSAKHLAGILVPFERLHGKALRDDEFMIDEGDRKDAVASIGPLRVIAHNLRSAFNVGSLLRTAECFGIEDVILAGYTPTPEETKTAKTSLGAQDSVTWSSHTVEDALELVKKGGYELVALETVASAIPLSDFVWPEKAALLLGNERFGLDDSVLKQAQHFVRIPLFGKKNSLNVGIAAGIAISDWREKLEQRSKASTAKKSFAAQAKTPVTERSLTYSPIGMFQANSVHKYEAPRQGVVNRSAQEGVVQLASEFVPGLKDLEGFDRVWLVYDFHHNKSWKPLVLPPRGPHDKRGLFATRSPYRPNAIGLSCVELVRVEGSKVFVRGHDLLDGSPILDIKPYIPYADSFPASSVGWLEGLESAKLEVSFSAAAYEQLEWLEANGVDQLRGFLISQLEFDPTDDSRKRVKHLSSAESPTYKIAYRTWRAEFEISNSEVNVTKISSGYTDDDLSSGQDKYGDHDLHRQFAARFT